MGLLDQSHSITGLSVLVKFNDDTDAWFRTSQVEPEAAPAPSREKLKAVRKEGGTRAADIVGQSHQGGRGFFCFSVDLPKGDAALLVESVKAMNEEHRSKKQHLEALGGSQHLGKCVVSAGARQVAVATYVPGKSSQDLGAFSAGRWLRDVV